MSDFVEQHTTFKPGTAEFMNLRKKDSTVNDYSRFINKLLQGLPLQEKLCKQDKGFACARQSTQTNDTKHRVNFL